MVYMRLLVFGCLLVLFVGCGGDDGEVVQVPAPVEVVEVEPEALEDYYIPEDDEPLFVFEEYEYTFSDTIVLGNFVVNFVDGIEWITTPDGEEAFRVPMEVTNISHVNQNPRELYFNLLDPDGNVLEVIGGYFPDYDFSQSPQIGMGATAYTYVHFLYRGRGVYSVMFDFGDWELPVRLPVF